MQQYQYHLNPPGISAAFGSAHPTGCLRRSELQIARPGAASQIPAYRWLHYAQRTSTAPDGASFGHTHSELFFIHWVVGFMAIPPPNHPGADNGSNPPLVSGMARTYRTRGERDAPVPQFDSCNGLNDRHRFDDHCSCRTSGAQLRPPWRWGISSHVTQPPDLRRL